jgi:hypothetical protein
MRAGPGEARTLHELGKQMSAKGAYGADAAAVSVAARSLRREILVHPDYVAHRDAVFQFVFSVVTRWAEEIAGGIWILSPDGRHLGSLELPENLHNGAWGDTDGRSLVEWSRSRAQGPNQISRVTNPPRRVTICPRVSGVIVIDAVGIAVPGHPIADFFSLSMDQVFELSIHNPHPFASTRAAFFRPRGPSSLATGSRSLPMPAQPCTTAA